MANVSDDVFRTELAYQLLLIRDICRPADGGEIQLTDDAGLLDEELAVLSRTEWKVEPVAPIDTWDAMLLGEISRRESVVQKAVDEHRRVRKQRMAILRAVQRIAFRNLLVRKPEHRELFRELTLFVQVFRANPRGAPPPFFDTDPDWCPPIKPKPWVDKAHSSGLLEHTLGALWEFQPTLLGVLTAGHILPMEPDKIYYLSDVMCSLAFGEHTSDRDHAPPDGGVSHPDAMRRFASVVREMADRQQHDAVEWAMRLRMSLGQLECVLPTGAGGV